MFAHMLELIFAFQHPIIFLVAESNPWNQFPTLTGSTWPSKIASETIFDLEKVYNQLKYGKTSAAAYGAVMIHDMTSGVLFHSENSG